MLFRSNGLGQRASPSGLCSSRPVPATPRQGWTGLCCRSTHSHQTLSPFVRRLADGLHARHSTSKSAREYRVKCLGRHGLTCLRAFYDRTAYCARCSPGHAPQYGFAGEATRPRADSSILRTIAIKSSANMRAYQTPAEDRVDLGESHHSLLMQIQLASTYQKIGRAHV